MTSNNQPREKGVSYPVFQRLLSLTATAGAEHHDFIRNFAL